MLWNIIYDFFVEHIFGGYSTFGVAYGGHFGNLYYLDGGALELSGYTNGDVLVKLGFIDSDMCDLYMPFGNYLSLIATIITMVIIVTLCALFIWKMVKLIGGLIR